MEPHNALPRHQFGYLSPLPVVDAMHYEFYQVVPRGVVFIATPLPIRSFTAAAAAVALAEAPGAIDYLRVRGAGRIIFGGIPVSAVRGRSSMLKLMDDEGRRVGVPVTSDFEDAIEALRSLSARKVAIAAKWQPPVIAAVVAYLAEAGFECVGACGGDYDARQVSTINTADSVDLGVALGRQALTAYPTADALLLGGGTWLSIPISAQLEREFKKPVVSNMTAAFWNALRQFGLQPAPNLGCRLLAS